MTAHHQPAVDANKFIKIQSSPKVIAAKHNYLILRHQQAELHIPPTTDVTWLAQLMQAFS